MCVNNVRVTVLKMTARVHEIKYWAYLRCIRTWWQQWGWTKWCWRQRFDRELGWEWARKLGEQQGQPWMRMSPCCSLLCKRATHSTTICSRRRSFHPLIHLTSYLFHDYVYLLAPSLCWSWSFLACLLSFFTQLSSPKSLVLVLSLVIGLLYVWESEDQTLFLVSIEAELRSERAMNWWVQYK